MWVVAVWVCVSPARRKPPTRSDPGAPLVNHPVFVDLGHAYRQKKTGARPTNYSHSHLPSVSLYIQHDMNMNIISKKLVIEVVESTVGTVGGRRRVVPINYLSEN